MKRGTKRQARRDIEAETQDMRRNAKEGRAGFVTEEIWMMVHDTRAKDKTWQGEEIGSDAYGLCSCLPDDALPACLFDDDLSSSLPKLMTLCIQAQQDTVAPCMKWILLWVVREKWEHGGVGCMTRAKNAGHDDINGSSKVLAKALFNQDTLL